MSSPKTTTTPDSFEEGNGAQSARLQRALVRLIFAFHGQDERVDENLKRLRGLLKAAPKSSSVFALLDELVEQIATINGKKSSTVSTQQQLAEFLNQIELTGEAANDARALQRRFGDSSSAIDVQRLIDETSALINRALKPRTLCTCPPWLNDTVLLPEVTSTMPGARSADSWYRAGLISPRG